MEDITRGNFIRWGKTSIFFDGYDKENTFEHFVWPYIGVR